MLFTGALSHQPASSAYDYTLTVPNTQTANPGLDDFYATLVHGSVFRARCQNPLKIQAILDTKSVNAHDPVLIGCVVSELYWIYP